MTKRTNNLSRFPQQVIADKIWYYENKGNIEVYISAELRNAQPDRCIIFRIPKSKLKRSLKRME